MVDRIAAIVQAAVTTLLRHARDDELRAAILRLTNEHRARQRDPHKRRPF